MAALETKPLWKAATEIASEVVRLPNDFVIGPEVGPPVFSSSFYPAAPVVAAEVGQHGAAAVAALFESGGPAVATGPVCSGV